MEGWTAAYHAAGIRPRGGGLTAQRLGCERNKSTTPPWARGMGTAGTVHAAGRETRRDVINRGL